MKKIKQLFITSILILLSVTNVYAKEPELCNREELPNNGVNKHWNITDRNINNVKNAPCVNAADKIYDFEDVLTDEEEDKLRKEIEEYIVKTKMDLVIVIKNIPYSVDSTNEDFAADFYDYNDFGLDYDKYSGSLLLRNTYEQDPYYDIYTFGNAQIYYDYDRLQVILDDIYDDLHEHRYYEGFSHYIELLNNYYDRGKGLKNYEVDENGDLHKVYATPFLILFVIASVITLIIMLILVAKNKMVKKATMASEYLDKSTAKITHREDQFLSTHTSSYTSSSSSGGGGGGHSHGSSGGGHSSGGGRHG